MQFGPGLWVTFLYYFTGMTFISAFIASKALGLSLSTAMPYRLGIMLGLLAGLVGTYFNRTTTLSLEFKNKKAFTANLNNVLAEMGYEQTSELDDVVVYQRPTLSSLFSGKVFVHLEKDAATIASRAANIRRLRNKI